MVFEYRARHGNYVEFEDIGRDIGTQMRGIALIVFFRRLGSKEQLLFLPRVGELYAVKNQIDK